MRLSLTILLVVLISIVSTGCAPSTRLINVSQTSGASLWPAIARTGHTDGDLQIVWREDPTSVEDEPVILHRRINRVDTQFNGNVQVLGESSLCSEDLEILVWGAYVYVAFMDRDDATNNCVVLVNSSSDSGQNFLPDPIPASPSSQNARRVRIAADLEKIAVAWTTDNNEVMLTMSEDGGETFLPSPYLVAMNVDALNSAAISWADDAVLVAYCNMAEEMYVNVWPHGASAGADTRLDAEIGPRPVCGYERALSFRRGQFPNADYVAWVDRTAAGSWVLRAKRRFLGNWSEPFHTAISFFLPAGAAIAGSPYVLYGALNDGYIVMFRRAESFPPPSGFLPGDDLHGCTLLGLEDVVVRTTSNKVHIAFEDCGRVHYRRADNGQFNVGTTTLGALEFNGTPLEGRMIDMEAHISDHFIVYSTLLPNPEVWLYTRRY